MTSNMNVSSVEKRENEAIENKSSKSSGESEQSNIDTWPYL